MTINLGPLHFKTIHLDRAFIQDNWDFIAKGVWVTIALSLVSIIIATILAVLTALGRLSTFPPLYALCTFYVSLIRGTPLYLQIFFFFLALPQLGHHHVWLLGRCHCAELELRRLHERDFPGGAHFGGQGPARGGHRARDDIWPDNARGWCCRRHCGFASRPLATTSSP